MACPTQVLIGLPKTAPAGTRINVEVGVPNWVILPDTVRVEVRYIAGTDVNAYDRLSSGGGTLLGTATMKKCSTKTIGSFSLPKSGATVMAIISPANVYGGKLYATWRIQAGQNLVTNASMDVNPTAVTTVPGGSFGLRVALRVPNDSNTHRFHVEVDTPWGVYRTTDVTTKGMFGINPSFTIRVPSNARGGTYTLTVRGYIDGKLVATRQVKVTVKAPVVQPQPKPTPTPTPTPQPVPSPEPQPKPVPVQPGTGGYQAKSPVGPALFLGSLVLAVMLFGKH